MTCTLLQGDCLTVLKTLPDESVNCCITSPPYWGLRDYGTAKWEGGDEKCDHKIPKVETDPKQVFDGSPGSHAIRFNRERCHKCGAKRIDSQLGLEKTPEEYVAKLVEIFREIRRALRKDGTAWLNLGDSYAATKEGNTNEFEKKELLHSMMFKKTTPKNLKPKDLVGVPWRVAFALQADGWWLRQDIVWHKPNPMPESVTDRCTKSHEYIFLLTKSARYYYDAEAIKEDSIHVGEVRTNTQYGKNASMGKYGQTRGGFIGEVTVTEKRNKRSVWTVTTKPYRDAHFATYPPKLITPCVLAGCPENGTVLDPFNGSGTTGLVALTHNRNYIGIELNPKYLEMTKRRLNKIQPKLIGA